MPQVNIDLINHKGTEASKEVIDEIRESILSQGQHHPLLVKATSDGRYNLIAGEKRLAALKGIQTEIDCKIYPSHLTDNEIFEISLHENLKRWNLPWYEQVTERKKLHDLRVKIHGEKVNGRPKISTKPQGWSQADTARELNLSIGQFSEDLMLANALQTNPSLARVKDKTTALKLVKQQAKREIAMTEALMPADIEMDQILLGDSLSILPNLPPNTFDACITDPPWTEYARDAELTADDSTMAVFKEVYRVLKADSFLYLICSTTDFFTYHKLLPTFGFRVQAYPIIWHKTGTITHGRRPSEYARDYEPILIASKGSPVLVPTTEQSAILRFESMHYTRMIHPHEKPIELLERLIRDCTWDGGKVLEPFAGSGVTLEACKKLGRQFIGIERDQDFYKNIVKRLEKE